jgi:FixJ family two-component response regulator
VPVIVLTGEPEVAGATHLFKRGIVDELAKLISPEKLTQVVLEANKDHAFNDPFGV